MGGIGECFTTTTKGKEQSGRVPEDVRKEIERAALSFRAPFSGLTAPRIADRFLYLVKKLHATGKLRARYSVHDLRHAFAVELYQETRNVYAVEKALGHATVAVTETYLRSLGLKFDSAGASRTRYRPGHSEAEDFPKYFCYNHDEQYNGYARLRAGDTQKPVKVSAEGARMRVYQIVSTSRNGLSLSAGTRLVITGDMEEQGI
jgi:hypothetical protein